MARYYLQSKRKDTDEEWSEWTNVNEYGQALKHLEKIKEAGYDGRLVPSKEVKLLWYFLGEKETRLTDEILDAGFCLRNDTVNHALWNLKSRVHEKAVFAHSKDEYSYINLNVFDALVQRMIKYDPNEK